MRNNQQIYNRVTPIFFIIPLVLVLTCFVIIPIIGTIITSFHQDIAFKELKFVFLNNYTDILSDPNFWQSFRFTFLFTVVTVPIEICLGLLFALVLYIKHPLRFFLRTVVLIPWAIPAAISARVWELIYNYSYGLANYLIRILHISSQPVNWLGTDIGAFSSLVLADVWKTTPFVAIIILAGLATIPEELYEQAKVDGSNFLQRFFNITLPLIRPVIVVSLLFRTADALRIFDIIYVITNGGPGGATSSVSHFSFQFFLNSDFGRSGAVSIILFIIALAFSLLYLKFGKFKKDLS